MIEKFLLVWLVSFILLAFFDLIWFTVSLEPVYKPLFKDIQKKFITRAWSVVVVWVLIGLFIAIELCWNVRKTPFDPRVLGFIYGFIIYGVYNFTNYSTIYKYNIKVVFIDSIWGSLNVGVSFILATMFLKLFR